MRKYQWHTDSHLGLAKKLNTLGAADIAILWTTLEGLRTNGWYPYQATPSQVTQAQQAWQAIRDWATT